MIDGAQKISKEMAAANHYDLIICSNVLEHTSFPIDIILSIKELMRPDTLLYVELPLENIIRKYSPKIGLSKKKHWLEHINFYSENSIMALLGNAGLSIIDFNLLEACAGSNTSWQYQKACKLS